MKILVTGAKGFVGKNLCAELRNIKDGKSRCWGDLVVDEVFEYDVDSVLLPRCLILSKDMGTCVR